MGNGCKVITWSEEMWREKVKKSEEILTMDLFFKTLEWVYIMAISDTLYF